MEVEENVMQSLRKKERRQKKSIEGTKIQLIWAKCYSWKEKENSLKEKHASVKKKRLPTECLFIFLFVAFFSLFIHRSVLI